VPVRHKDQWEAEPQFAQAVEEARHELDGHGRVLVRPSGTEPALRIMVEGDSDEHVARIADQLATLAIERLN
jgi:phosphoglucosamine mutase